MTKLFGLITITKSVTSQLYKPGDKALVAYFFRRLLPNTTVIAVIDDVETVRTITKVTDDKVWFGDPARPQKSDGLYNRSCVKGVLVLRYRPRNNRLQ